MSLTARGIHLLSSVPAAWYTRTFVSTSPISSPHRSPGSLTVQHAWYRAFLTFEAVTSAFYCWVNGAAVGYSQDSCLPAEFDVSNLLQPGTNSLAVQVILCMSQCSMRKCLCLGAKRQRGEL